MIQHSLSYKYDLYDCTTTILYQTIGKQAIKKFYNKSLEFVDLSLETYLQFLLRFKVCGQYHKNAQDSNLQSTANCSSQIVYRVFGLVPHWTLPHLVNQENYHQESPGFVCLPSMEVFNLLHNPCRRLRPPLPSIELPFWAAKLQFRPA